MVKLLRLKSNTIGGTEIRNHFRETIRIKPQSKVALVGMDVKLQALPSNESFNIVAADTLTVDIFTVTPRVNSYTQSELIQELQIQTNLAPTSGVVGLDYAVSYVNNKLQFKKWYSPSDEADFDANFSVAQGNPTITGNSYTADGTEADQIISLSDVPNATYQLTATFTTADDCELGVINMDGTYLHGLGIDNGLGRYTKLFNGGTSDTGVAYSDGDICTLTRIGNQLTWTVKKAGVTIYSSSETLTVALYETYFIGEGCFWSIQNPIGSTAAIDDVKLTDQLATRNNNLSVTFNSDQIQDYCGFSSPGPHTNSGNPALVEAENPMVGDEKYPGILVCLGPTTLDSYDGYSQSKFPESILHVIHSTESFGRKIAFDVNNFLKLGLRNAQEVSINELRVTFRGQAAELLRFVGEPTVTIAIFDPDE